MMANRRKTALLVGGAVLAGMILLLAGYWIGSGADLLGGAALAGTAGGRVGLATGNFSIRCDQGIAGNITYVGGIGSISDVTEQRVVEGGRENRESISLSPGDLHYSKLDLYRPLTSDRTAAEWREEVVLGRIASARKNCSIYLSDKSNKAIAQWDLTNVWPSAHLTPVSLPDEAAESSSGVLYEQLTLVYSSVRRIK
jgi:phage tail-like protein